jgi:uncharacterized membrane protein YfbV (UPF0208 family)
MLTRPMLYTSIKTSNIGKLAVMTMCWQIGFASFYYDFLVYEVDLVRSCISGIIDWLGLWGLTPLSTIF